MMTAEPEAETAALFRHLDTSLADCRAAMIRLDAKAETEERNDAALLQLLAERGDRHVR